MEKLHDEQEEEQNFSNAVSNTIDIYPSKVKKAEKSARKNYKYFFLLECKHSFI